MWKSNRNKFSNSDLLLCLPVCGFQPDGKFVVLGGGGIIVDGRSLSTNSHSSGKEDLTYLV